MTHFSHFRAPLTVIALTAIFFCGYPVLAQSHIDSAESTQILLENMNQARLQQGLSALSIDAGLAQAAQRHADLMVESGMLEHQLPGEPGLAERCNAAGGHFSSIAENIAEGGSLKDIHASWMQSQAHRDNIVTPGFTAVGIGVARRGRAIYAVADFSVSVESQTPRQVEQRVGDMLAIRNIAPTVDASYARAFCVSGSRDYRGEGPPPSLAMQFTSPDLSRLGPILDQKIKPGLYQTASVGACSDTDSRGFTRFKLALLLY